ncbi:hypothetical protein, partial [Glaesserella parasuis]|uniref:hypothetical protein n=4 Tax=Bacteria TaxID=2 RepID=UPI003F3E612C
GAHVHPNHESPTRTGRQAMSINRHRMATYITIATTAAIIAVKAQPGTKTHTASAELATAMLANVIARAVKARCGK